MKKSELRQIIKEEIKRVLNERSYIYSDKGTKYTAQFDGKFDDIEWEGDDGHSTSLDKSWVKGAKSRHKEGDVVVLTTDLWYDESEGLYTEGKSARISLKEGLRDDMIAQRNIFKEFENSRTRYRTPIRESSPGGMKLLNKIQKDWGTNSDLYYEIEDALVANVDSKTIKNILENYDVLVDYKQYLKYI
jgi:hypothetical protein